MSDGIGIEMFGDKDVMRALDELGKVVTRKVVRAAVNLAVNPILAAAKAACPVGESGLLRKSLGKRLRTYPDGTVYCAVGPRSGFKEIVGAKMSKAKGLRGLLGGTDVKAVYRNPTKYAHLVEFGHGGPHPAKANGFLRKAYDSEKSVAFSIWQIETINGIEAEAAKLAKGKT